MALAAALVLAIVVVVVRSRGDDDPAVQIRAALDRAVVAAEARDVGGVMAIVSERFDSAQANRDDVRRALFVRLRGEGWRRVVLTEVVIDVEDAERPERAKVALIAILARSESKDGTWRDLAPSEASIYRFDLDFVLEDGDWRVRQAAYRRAQLGEP